MIIMMIIFLIIRAIPAAIIILNCGSVPTDIVFTTMMYVTVKMTVVTAVTRTAPLVLVSQYSGRTCTFEWSRTRVV